MTTPKKTLGIIGGMGPLATARLYELVTLYDMVEREQEHFNVVIISAPSAPDRTAFILGQSADSPAPYITQSAKKLASLGADYLVMPCITSHCLLGEIDFPRPLISLTEETMKRLQENGCRRLGLLATDGTIATGLFAGLAARYGLELLLPDDGQQVRVMDVIYNQVKRGRTDAAGGLCGGSTIQAVADTLFSRGAEAVVLGCTELSLLDINGPGFADPLKIAAQRAVELCGGKGAIHAKLA
jgi:aspartate racemase